MHTFTEQEEELKIRRDTLQLLRENAWAIINHDIWKEQWAQLQRDEAAFLIDKAEVLGRKQKNEPGQI